MFGPRGPKHFFFFFTSFFCCRDFRTGAARVGAVDGDEAPSESSVSDGLRSAIAGTRAGLPDPLNVAGLNGDQHERFPAAASARSG